MAAILRRIAQVAARAVRSNDATHTAARLVRHAAGAALWGWVVVALLVLALLALGLYAWRRWR